MTPKMQAILALYALIGSSMGQTKGLFYDEDKFYPKNKPKKCHRPECEVDRERGKLYCSAECNKLDKERIKILNKKTT